MHCAIYLIFLVFDNVAQGHQLVSFSTCWQNKTNLVCGSNRINSSKNTHEQIKRLLESLIISTSQNPNLQRWLGLVREKGEESGTVSTVSDWCILLASLTPPYIGMGRPRFPPLGWPPWPLGLTNKAQPIVPTRPRKPHIKFISTNHNFRHFISGMGRATRKLSNRVILSYHQTNITVS